MLAAWALVIAFSVAAWFAILAGSLFVLGVWP